MHCPFVGLTATMVGEIAVDAAVCVVPDAGHRIAEENPDGLVEALRHFDGHRGA